MSIDRRPNGKWRVRHPGMPSKTFDRKADAQTYEAKIRTAKQTGTTAQIGADKQTLAELAAEYIAANRDDLAAKTLATYMQLWAAHVDGRVRLKSDDDPATARVQPIANMTLRQITPEVVEKWRDARRADGAGIVAVRRTMALMQAMFDRAERYGRTPGNPVRLVKKPKTVPTGAVEVIAPAQVEKIRAELDETGATMVSVLAYAGLRPGELRALRWKDVGTKTIRVERATDPDGTIKPTKTGSARNVRLLKPLADDLTAWKAKRGRPKADELIFPRADGSPWTEGDWTNWRNRQFSPAAKGAKVTISRPYDLRHAAASLWIMEGTNPAQVAAWLGHNVAMTFKTYTHVIAEIDPKRRPNAAKTITAARRQDTSGTHGDVKAGPKQSTAKPKKSASKPVATTSA